MQNCTAMLENNLMVSDISLPYNPATVFSDIKGAEDISTQNLHLYRICLQGRRHGFDPWVGKILWKREWQHTPVFLHGKSHGQRSLVGYSPWDHKSRDITEATGHQAQFVIWCHILKHTLDKGS